MKKKDKEILAAHFADKVSFHKTERLLYSHDAASLPDIVKQLIRTVPDAVVQPLTADDVVFLIKFARERKIPITPRGAASSGWGGVIPSRGGIVVDFTRMRRILEISPDKLSARVEAGVIWKNLEAELNKSGLACCILPSSALSATVGGWVAEGGGGIGSYEYGQISKNITSVKIVDAEGNVKVFSGNDLEIVSEAEGITGLITEIEVKTRVHETDIPMAASFVEMRHLLKALNEINRSSLDLWHVSFSNASFNTKQDQSEIDAELVKPRWGDEENIPEEKVVSVNKCTALFVYPESRKSRIEPLIQDIIRQNKGTLENRVRTNKLWEDRYYPIRLKRLGPSLISSESIIRTKIDHLENVIEEIETQYPDISLTITMLSRQEASVLGNILGDERSPVFTFQFPESLKIIDTACKYDGCPYSLGLYFTKFANKNLGLAKVRQIGDFKKKTDPHGILNPGKILPENQNPVVINLTLALARFGAPLLSFGRSILSRKPRLAKSIPPQLAYEAWACAQCGYCIDVCDQYYGRQWESETTRGRWYFLRQYLKGKANFDQIMLDSFLLCTTCQRCNQVCQVKIPIQQMWDKMRGQVIFEKGYHTFPGFEMMASATILESNIWLGAKSERDKWVPNDVKPLEKGKIGYWAGCTASYVENDICQNAVHILKEGGVEFTYLGQDEACCGIPMYSAGKWDLFEKVVKHNIDELNKRGVEELIISCPGCWVTLNHYYREWAKKLGLKYDIRVKHITETTADLIKQGKLKFKQAPKDKGKVTYHDPCHIGRHGGIYDAPRDILKSIPEIELIEMEHHADNGLCCGSVLSRVGRPPAADAIGAYRIGEAEATGAGILITNCPCCEVQLRTGARFKKSNVRVLDMSDLVAEALGYEVPDPTYSVLDAWDVFGTAIDIMTVNGMNEMMGKMMPEVMAAMPGVMKGMMGMIKGMPAYLRHPMLNLMKKMVPVLMPMLLPGMLPALTPRALELMKEAIPNMPPAMKARFPDVLPGVMSAIVPPMLPRLAPLIAPKMTEYLEAESIKSRAEKK